MKKLKDFPILQRLVDIYRKINQAEKKDYLIEYIEEDMVFICISLSRRGLKIK